MKKLVAFAAPVLASVGAFAADGSSNFVTGTTIDTAPVLTMAGLVVGAIASIWAIKKVIALGNKS